MQLPLDADGYVARIKPTNDPEKVAVFTLNRHQDCLRIYMANPLSTLCKLVVEDRVDKYISEDSYAQAIITDNHLLLLSERSGFNSIYVYALNGQQVRSVTNGVVTNVYGFDEVTGDIFYAALPEGPLNKKVFVSHRNGKTDCLTPRDGWNTAIFAKNFKSALVFWSDINTPPTTTLQQIGGKGSKVLIDNKELASKYASYDMGKKEFFTFTTSEGVKLNGWLVKPLDFNSSKRYPVVMYQYGGPGNQQVRNDWGIGICGQGAIMEQYLCQQGFICVCVDNRGTGGRGVDFEKCTYLRLGELEAHDQVEAALWLGQQSYVDKERIAIWGWSYGGFNTLMSMSEGRDVFRCGIAIAPPTSWRYYDTVYSERFMRTPKENPNGYDDNPIARVKKLHGALLLCHGLADDNVHYRNTAEYTDALIDADKDYQQLVYSNRNHSIYGGNTRNHLFRQCVKFLKKECQRQNR
jgi:dipeptidyl-peptidase-4